VAVTTCSEIGVGRGRPDAPSQTEKNLSLRRGFLSFWDRQPGVLKRRAIEDHWSTVARNNAATADKKTG
jgi:hypothetical protein